MYNYLCDPGILIHNQKIKGWVICFINDSNQLDLYKDPYQYELDQKKYSDNLFFKTLKEFKNWCKRNEIDDKYIKRV